MNGHTKLLEALSIMLMISSFVFSILFFVEEKFGINVALNSSLDALYFGLFWLVMTAVFNWRLSHSSSKKEITNE